MPEPERDAVIASLEIEINGSRLPPEAATDLFHLEVLEDLDTPSMFTLSLNAGDPATGEIKWADDALFPLGAEVKIKAGFRAPLPELTVGEVTGLEPEYPARGPLLLTVRGFDRLHRLRGGRKSRTFLKMSDSDIASQIARDWNLTPEVEATTVRYEHVFQRNQTDLEFLLLRARRIGYEVKVEGRSLIFRAPREDRAKQVALTYGEELLEFSPRLSLAAQVTEVLVQGWDPKRKEPVTGRAGSGDERSRMGGQETGAALAQRIVGPVTLVAVDDSLSSLEEAEALARAALNSVAFELVTGEGTCMGNPQIRAGIVVELRGLGRRFSGLYYVVGCAHAISARRGYSTTFTVRRSAT
jgi:phage protein D